MSKDKEPKAAAGSIMTTDLKGGDHILVHKDMVMDDPDTRPQSFQCCEVDRVEPEKGQPFVYKVYLKNPKRKLGGVAKYHQFRLAHPSFPVGRWI